MDAELKKRLLDAGVNVDASVRRLLDDETLFLKVLEKFKDDDSFAALKQAVSNKNVQDAFEASHALKGIAGNLGMERLLEELSPIVEALRVQSFDGVEAHMKGVEKNYIELTSIIEKL